MKKLSTLMFALMAMAATVRAQVIISEKNFLDKNFLAYVKENCDQDKDGSLNASEINAVISMDVTKRGITNLQGVEYFTELTELICYGSSLESLDVSKNTKLTYLDCSYNKLTALDVSKNIALTRLECNGNQIKDDKMTALMNSLPEPRAGGKLYVIDTTHSDEQNVCTRSQVAIAQGKGWKVYDYNGDINYALEYGGIPDPTTWYGYASYVDEEVDWRKKFIRFTMDDPATVTAASEKPADTYAATYAATYTNGEVWFIKTGMNGGHLCKAPLDKATKIIGEEEIVVSGFEAKNMNAIEMDYNPADGKIYYLVDTYSDSGILLKSFDPKNPPTTSGTGVKVNGTMRTLAINAKGEAYGIEDTTADLYKLNLKDGTTTLVGSTGLACYFSQSMAFNLNTGELFWAQYSSQPNKAFYKVDPATAAVTEIGKIGNRNVELTGLFMVYDDNHPDVNNPFDLNGDGAVNVGDVTTLVSAVLGGNAPATYDVNGDGVVNVGDVTVLVGVVLGGGGGSAAEGAQTIKVGSVSFTMLPVSGGTFQMGSPASDTDAWDDEKPQHSVTLSDYYMGETEVTQALWLEVMGSNPSEYLGDSQRPVERVSWDNCQEFITKLNEKTGKTFRLPTEAEWEYAARGGSKSQGYKYAGSNDLASVAWYEKNSSSITHPVKQKQANELGLYDMTGNVFEWCSDRSGDYSSFAQTNPTGPSTGSFRVCRGGSWNNDARFCRVATRSWNTPSGRDFSLGLRLAMSK